MIDTIAPLAGTLLIVTQATHHGSECHLQNQHSSNQEKFAMPYTHVSAQLTELDIQEIKELLTLLNNKLPFLIHLTPEERRALTKMGDKSYAFVSNSLIAAQANPTILPSSFDLDEFAQTYQLAESLSEIHISLKQLYEKVDDTLLAVGSESMSSSLTVYEYVKTAAKRIPGLKAIAEQLSARFKVIRTKALQSKEMTA
jgi:protein-tyrosine-phosphatase